MMYDVGGSIVDTGLVNIGTDEMPRRKTRDAEDGIDGAGSRAYVQPSNLNLSWGKGDTGGKMVLQQVMRGKGVIEDAVE